VPQGVLCKHVFRNNSWSWGVITHHCHRLRNIPVQFFPPCDPSSSPSTRGRGAPSSPCRVYSTPPPPFPPPAGHPDRRRSGIRHSLLSSSSALACVPRAILPCQVAEEQAAVGERPFPERARRSEPARKRRRDGPRTGHLWRRHR
jgi:hypothetical protein